MRKMKRNTKATAILLAALIAAAAAGCGSSESSNSSSYSSSTIPSSQVSSDSVSSEPQKLGLEGDLKYGYIKLNNVYFQADNRNNALVINWKNTTSVSTTFDDCFNVVLYLDGEKLPHKEIHQSYTTSDGFKVDSDTIYQEVSPGETVTVDYLFDLNSDANSDSILTMYVYATTDDSKAVCGECEVYLSDSSSSSAASSNSHETILNAENVSNQIILDFLNSYDLPKGKITVSESSETENGTGGSDLIAIVDLDMSSYDSPENAATDFIEFAADLSLVAENLSSYKGTNFFYYPNIENSDDACVIFCSLADGEARFSTFFMNTLSNTEMKNAIDTAYHNNLYFNARDIGF